MEYTTLTQEQQADFYRRRVLQAEADHLTHTTDAQDQQTILAVIPAGKQYDAERAAVQQQIDALTNLATAAEERCANAVAKLDEMGEPIVLPEPQSDSDRVAELAARVEQLTDALVAAKIDVPADTAPAE